MTLQEKLDTMKKEFIAKAPPETTALMQKSTYDLQHSGILDHVLKAGDIAPEFTLDDENGNSVNSRDFLNKGPLVITFYRGSW